MRRPYYVYGGLQDNGSWCGPSRRAAASPRHLNPTGIRIGSGDGFYVAVDPTDHTTVYVERRTACTADRRPRSDQSHRRGGPSVLRPATGPPRRRRRQRLTSSRHRRCAGRWWAAAAVAARGGGTPNIVNALRRRAVPLQLEHADPSLAAQPAHHLRRRRTSSSNRDDRGDTWTASADLTQADRPRQAA